MALARLAVKRSAAAAVLPKLAAAPLEGLIKECREDQQEKRKLNIVSVLASRYEQKLIDLARPSPPCPKNIANLLLFFLAHGATTDALRASFESDPSFLETPFDEARFAQVMSFLRELCGGDEGAARRVVRRYPPIFRHDAARLRRNVDCLRSLGVDAAKINPKYLGVQNMEAKMEFLCSQGVSSEALGKLSSERQFLLKLSLDDLKSKVELLAKNCISGKFLERLLLKYPWVLNSHNMAIEAGAPLFQQVGLHGLDFAKMVAWYPGTLRAAKSLQHRAEFLARVGLDTRSDVFISALRIASSVNRGCLDSRLQRMAEYGFNANETADMFRKQPRILLVSDEFLSRKMNFLQKCVKLPREQLLSSPNYLIYSLEKRLEPRFRAAAMLRLHGLLQGPHLWKKTFYSTNAQFRMQVGCWHPDALALLEAHGLLLKPTSEQAAAATSNV